MFLGLPGPDLEGTASGRSMTTVAGFRSGSNSQRHGSADPDPHQNVMDPEHWSQYLLLLQIY